MSAKEIVCTIRQKISFPNTNNNNANYFFYSLIFFQSRLSDSNVSGEKTHLSLTDGLSVKGGEFSLRAVCKVCN